MFLCFCEIHRIHNLWFHHRHCQIMEVILCLFLLNPKYIKMKFGQILVCCMRKISNMFLGQCWRLKTSSRPIYGFIKTTIWWDPAIFNSWHLPFLNVPYLLFQKNETLESWRYWLLRIWSPPNCSKNLWKLLPLLLYLSNGQVWWLNELWFKRYIQKCMLSHVLKLIMTSQIW